MVSGHGGGENSGRFGTDLSFDELKRKAEQISGCGCITGDGCLVSHICERGILNRLRSLYPHANIQTIEYDYDSSDTLRESRIQMALGDFS